MCVLQSVLKFVRGFNQKVLQGNNKSWYRERERERQTNKQTCLKYILRNEVIPCFVNVVDTLSSRTSCSKHHILCQNGQLDTCVTQNVTFYYDA